MLRSTVAKITTALKMPRAHSLHTTNLQQPRYFFHPKNFFNKKLVSFSLLGLGMTAALYKHYQNQEHIVVIGLGPVGLAHAIEACRHGNKKVIALTDRDNYSRTQIFLLNSATFDYMQDLLGEDKIEELIEEGKLSKLENVKKDGDWYNMKISALEQALYEKLRQYQEKNLEIIRVKEGSAPIIDGNDKTIKIQTDRTQKTVKFKYIIEADGANRAIFNSVSRKYYANISSDQMGYYNLPKKHSVITYKLPDYPYPANYQQQLTQTPKKMPSIDAFKKFGWTWSSYPEARIFICDRTLFLGTECPNDLRNIKAEIDQWARLTLKLHFDEEYISTLTNIPDEGSTFTVQVNRVNSNNIRFLPDNISYYDKEAHQKSAFLFVVGDALHKPHYQTGSGVNLGLKESKFFGKLLKSPQNDINHKVYNRKIETDTDTYKERVNHFLHQRQEREYEARYFEEKYKEMNDKLKQPEHDKRRRTP